MDLPDNHHHEGESAHIHGPNMNNAPNSFGLFSPTSSAEVDEIQKKIENKLIKKIERESIQRAPTQKKSFFDLSDISMFLTDGMEVIVEDEFTKCFTSPQHDSWNWNLYLFPAWIMGIFIRFCVLFPLRLLLLLLGTSVFAIAFITVSFVKNTSRRSVLQRHCIRLYCSVWVMSWSGVIKYHGVKPNRAPNQIFVANHTTVMDVIVLQQAFNYAVVGQAHPGIMGFFQKYVFSCMGCLWFNRSESKDRLMVAQKIKEHIHDPSNNPLLIFPEGVCVNNEYCVMFKKGAFELEAEVHPVAIRYNKTFVDAYWNSKKQSFMRHVFNLMTSWALVCDVWYLEPQRRKPNETPTQFANRVKELIARKAGLINVHWDGYLKYFQPSSRFMETKQRVFASSLISKYSSSNLAGLEKLLGNGKPKLGEPKYGNHLGVENGNHLVVENGNHLVVENGKKEGVIESITLKKEEDSGVTYRGSKPQENGHEN
eukprot:TRINITY_DN1743_c0_g1_i1.p1 TRINITY_DN1743_c0_g1~~TRINITY_DN1743_c0_g1_i1.p1  ORF type:complete len:482 (+),score=84.44 TRINITY_DN1743_c0_g1_i1:201-1646(+)